jgi:hypothetical protein
VVVSLALTRQERRHRIEKEWEYELLGREMPPVKVKQGIQKSTAITHIILGAGLVAFGGIALYALWLVESIGMQMGGQYIAALFLAAGVVLVTAGVKGLRENRLNRKDEA